MMVMIRIVASIAFWTPLFVRILMRMVIGINRQIDCRDLHMIVIVMHNHRHCIASENRKQADTNDKKVTQALSRESPLEHRHPAPSGNRFGKSNVGVANQEQNSFWLRVGRCGYGT